VAFSTKSNETSPKKGILKCVDTFLDAGPGNGNSHQLPDAVTIVIQASGTFGAGPGTITIKYSNDGITYFALSTAIAFAAAGLKTVAQADLGAMHYRGEATSGDATTNITLTWIAKIRQAGTP